jgi:SAM-dependent methyltransferase
MVEYDRFADIYDVWIQSAPVTERNRPFYVEEYLGTRGIVVELGIGNGRIAIEAARRGKAVTGVDSSPAMLALCRQRAEAAGVAPLLTLLQADWREFTLPEPAALISIPFHSIGHLVTLEDKRAGLRRIYQQLAPGGRLVLDHFVFDPEAARRATGPRVRAEYIDDETGREVLLWSTARYSFADQTMRVFTWSEELDAASVVVRKQYRRLSFSWIEPEQMRALLTDTGFAIEALYGDFDRRPFGADNPEQIWVARRPDSIASDGPARADG